MSKIITTINKEEIKKRIKELDNEINIYKSKQMAVKILLN